MPQTRLVYRRMVLATVVILLSTAVHITTNPIHNPFAAKENDGGFSSSGHALNKRSFYDIHCKGTYDKSIFARVDQICEDCYNLFREPKLHTLCRQSCFTSDYFKGCVEVLLMQDDAPGIQEWIRKLNGLGI